MKNSEMIYRRNGKKIYIKQPEISEFSFVSKLWGDYDTMKDIGGVYEISESKWEMFYNKMVYPGDGKNFYCLVYNAITSEPVGEVSFHGYDCVTKSARFNIKILYSERRKGYGEEALRLLLEYYFLDFGGNMIIDNVTTEAGLNLINKFGFEITGQYKDEIGVRLDKDNFQSQNKLIKRTVGMLLYDNMNMLDYALADEIVRLANDLNTRKVFEIKTISFNDKVNFNNKLSLNVKKEWDSCDVLIIPGGRGYIEAVNNKEYINFLKETLKRCDFVCAQGEGLKFLINCNVLDGIFVPKHMVSIEDKNIIPERRLIDKSFIDNGKIMLSSNIIGEIESILRLIDKVCGKELAKKVGIKLGVTY